MSWSPVNLLVISSHPRPSRTVQTVVMCKWCRILISVVGQHVFSGLCSSCFFKIGFLGRACVCEWFKQTKLITSYQSPSIYNKFPVERLHLKQHPQNCSKGGSWAIQIFNTQYVCGRVFYCSKNPFIPLFGIPIVTYLACISNSENAKFHEL